MEMPYSADVATDRVPSGVQPPALPYGSPPYGWYPPPPSSTGTSGALIFVAIVQFLVAVALAFLGLFWLLLLLGYHSTDPAGYLVGLAFTGVVALHVTLGVGILRARRWALIMYLVASAIYAAGLLWGLIVTIRLPPGGRRDGIVLLLILLGIAVGTNIVTAMQLKRGHDR